VEQAEQFVCSYLDLLRAGGSGPPEELGEIVGETSPSRASGARVST